MELITIGHSTHSEEGFLKLLQDSEIQRLVDARAFPGSPHFSQNQMQVWLNKGISAWHEFPADAGRYQHLTRVFSRHRKLSALNANFRRGQ